MPKHWCYFAILFFSIGHFTFLRAFSITQSFPLRKTQHVFVSLSWVNMHSAHVFEIGLFLHNSNKTPKTHSQCKRVRQCKSCTNRNLLKKYKIRIKRGALYGAWRLFSWKRIKVFEFVRSFPSPAKRRNAQGPAVLFLLQSDAKPQRQVTAIIWRPEGVLLPTVNTYPLKHCKISWRKRSNWSWPRCVSNRDEGTWITHCLPCLAMRSTTGYRLSSGTTSGSGIGLPQALPQV